MSSLDRAAYETASVCSRVDILVATYVKSQEEKDELLERQKSLDKLGPFSYLGSGPTTRIWETSFTNLMSAFETKGMLTHEYLLMTEKIGGLSTELDKNLVELKEEMRKYPNMRPCIMANAIEMQMTLRTFLNTSKHYLEVFKAREGIPSHSTPGSRLEY